MKRYFILVSAILLILVSCSFASAIKTINGIVVNDAGKAVSDAKITLLEGKENDEGIIKGSAVSDINGKFSISYQPSGASIYNFVLHLTAATDSELGFGTIVNSRATQRITVSPLGSITGAIKSPDGRPVQGVVIKPSIFVKNAFLGQRYMNYRSIESAVRIFHAESDSRGIFTIKGLPIGWEIHLTAYIGGLPVTKPVDWIGQWSDTQSAFPEPESDANAIRTTFITDGQFDGSGGIMGNLYDTSEKPMPGITVTAIRTEKGAFVKGENPISVITDSNGKYLFNALKPGVYAISVFEGEEPVPMETDVRVVKDDITKVPLYAIKGIVVAGRVTDQTTGKGLAGVIVASSETRPVITAKDGSFKINMLPGEGLILANGESVGYYPLGRKITIPETGKLNNISIKLTRINRLYGTVKNSLGKPVDGVWIQSMWLENPGELYQADAAGNYRIITDDRKSITLIATDQLFRNAAIKTIKLSQNSTKMDIKLLPTASLTGTVKNRDGKAIPNARITPMIVLSKYRLAGIENQVYSNISGNFRINGFIPGANYILRIRAEGYEEMVVQSSSMPKLISGKTTSAEFKLVKKY
ncbi:MAG: hypothetical protein ACYC0V_11125 [Armatimonadota bacterium]